jgi:sugar phosphate permease
MFIAIGVWQGVAMDSLKYPSGPPCLTLLRPAGRRPMVVFYPFGHPVPLMFIASSPAFGRDVTVNAVLMGVVGFFIGGAANIISAAICADMGRLDELRGNSEALATVTGIVDGTGSVGAGKKRVLIWLC